MNKEEKLEKDIYVLNEITNLCIEINKIVDCIIYEDEYKRLRDYINSRFGISFPYELDKFKKISENKV